jgi:outer membrane protein
LVKRSNFIYQFYFIEQEVLAMFVATIRKLLVVSSALTMFVALGAQAEVKIGVVNFQRLGDESPQAKVINQTMQNEFAPRQRELQQKQKDLQAKQEKLQRDGATMTDAERGSLEKDLAKGERDLKSQGDAFTEEVNSFRNEQLGKLQNELVQHVQDFAKSNGYDLVLANSIALFVKDPYDITNQVLTYLQAHSTDAKPAPAAKAPAK